MSILTPCPFIAGPPVENEYFIGRDADLRYVLTRLISNGQSTALTGEPHIGKTSLLKKLADAKTRKSYLGEETAKNMQVVYLDLHGQVELTPQECWKRVLAPIEASLDRAPAELKALIEGIRYQSYTDRVEWEALLRYLADRKGQLIVLLDEFEALLPDNKPHPNFADFSFFAMLRALDAFPSFSYVTTSRLPVQTLSARATNLPGSGGSPVFNTQTEWRLKPFDLKTTAVLLEKAGGKFSEADHRYIQRLAGGHPFLLQSLSEMLWQMDRPTATQRFYETVCAHFDDLWVNLDNNTRTTAVILSLAELYGLAHDRDYAYGEIEQSDRFGPELARLRELGLATQVETSNHWVFEHDKLLVWRDGERWAISAKVFIWWVKDVVIAETRALPTYQDWLDKKEHIGPLTKEHWELLYKGIQSAPKSLISATISVLVDAVSAAVQKGRTP